MLQPILGPENALFTPELWNFYDAYGAAYAAAFALAAG
jgi:hypothetical protein